MNVEKELNKIKNMDVKKEAKDRTVSLSSWLPILVSLLAVLLVTLVLGLMDWDFSRIKTLNYWSEAILTTVVGVSIFTYGYFNFIDAERAKLGTAYRLQAERHHKYQEVILANQLRDTLIPKIDEENEKRKRVAISKELLKFGLMYDEFEKFKDAEDLPKFITDYCSKRGFNKKQTKSFIKMIKRCLYGGVKYDEINIDELLNDMDSDKDVTSSTRMVENSRYHSHVIEKRTFTTTAFSTILAVLVWRSIFDTKLLEMFIKSLMVILSNIFASSLKAKSYINYRRIILTNRNNFFAMAIPKEYLVDQPK